MRISKPGKVDRPTGSGFSLIPRRKGTVRQDYLRRLYKRHGLLTGGGHIKERMNAMERRWGTRRPISQKVMLGHGQNGLRDGCITDIGIGGMFVKTVTTSLTDNRHVSITLALEYEGVTQILQVQALIIHSTEDGVGLKFEKLSPGVIKLLLMLLLKNDNKDDFSNKLSDRVNSIT